MQREKQPQKLLELAEGLGQPICTLAENKSEASTAQLPAEEQLLNPELGVLVLQPDNSEKRPLSVSFVFINYS